MFSASTKYLIGLFAAISSTAAMAMPHVYQCKVVDYLESGTMTTDFQYVIGSGYQSIKSAYSEIRLNFSRQDQLFSVSIRPVDKVHPYARREDRGTPLNISLTHVIGEEYAATVRCKL